MKYVIPETYQELKEFFKNEYHFVAPIEIRGVFNHFRYQIFKKMSQKYKNNKLNNEIIDGKFEDISITKNNFAYSKLLSKLRAKHYIVWECKNTNDFSFNTVNESVKRWIRINLDKEYDIFLYKNSDSQKSIKTIEHYQLILIPKAVS
jgi:hypothetical protein